MENVSIDGTLGTAVPTSTSNHWNAFFKNSNFAVIESLQLGVTNCSACLNIGGTTWYANALSTHHHLPDALLTAVEQPWRRDADLGNILRT